MSIYGNKFIKGAAILGVAGVLIKFLGAVFRIPLTNWIGDTGMAYYGVAYTIYGALLVLSTAGIPVAISRLVSESIAIGQYRNAHKIFQVAVKLLFTIGVISFGICFLYGSQIAGFVGNDNAAFALKSISPALLFVPLLSAFRGYFQGQQNMNPTAVSEIVEQLVRVIVGLFLAYMLLKEGVIEASAGASFGASVGSISGLGIIVIIYFVKKKTIIHKIDLDNQSTEGTSNIIKNIITIAVPIVVGCEIMPIMSLIDTGIIMNRLQATGWTLEESTSLYGLLSGFCSSLITFPQVFTQAIAVSLVPVTAAAFKVNNRNEIHQNIKLGYRATMIMAFPCSFGIFALAEPIMFMLYPDQRASGSSAVPTLMIMAISVILLAVNQTSIGILQSIGKQMIPVVNLAIGCIGKVIITFTLTGIYSVNVKGAAIGTCFAYLIALILNNRCVKQYTGVKLQYQLTFFRPAVAAIIMAVCAFTIQKFLMIPLGSTLATLGAIGLSVIIYSTLIFAFKAITIDELRRIATGRKLKKYKVFR